MTHTRRRLLLSSLAATAAPSFVRAQSRPVLRVQTIGGAVEKTVREDIVPGFQTRTGIDVQVIVEDDVTILPKLQVARGRAPYDVCMMDNDKAILGGEMDVWAPDQSSKLANTAAVYESCRPPATANYGTIVFEYGLVYNTEKFRTPPTSWQDLWTPGVVAAVPHVSQAYGLTFLYLASVLNGGSGTNLEPGYAAIKRLGNFKIYKSVTQGLALFQQKEADAGLFYANRGQQLADTGMPIARTVPKEGTWGQHTGLQIPRGTANLEGAVAWVDTVLGIPAQTAFAKNGYSPVNRDVPLTPEQQKRLIFGNDRVNAIREAPWAEILPQRDAILDRWTREFGS